MNADILGIVSEHLCKMEHHDTALRVLSLDKNTYKTMHTEREAVLRKRRFHKAKKHLENFVSSWAKQISYTSSTRTGKMTAMRCSYKDGVYIRQRRDVFGRDCCYEHILILCGNVSATIIASDSKSYLVRALRGKEYNVKTGEMADGTWDYTTLHKDTYADITKDMRQHEVRGFCDFSSMFSWR